MPVAVVIDSTPSSPRKKSKCHHERRNSPSVASFRPTSSCFLTIFSISRSSTALNAAASISFLAYFVRASFRVAVRRRLPTWSARKGGAVRGDMTVSFPLDYWEVIPFIPATQPTLASRASAGFSPPKRGARRQKAGPSFPRDWIPAPYFAKAKPLWFRGGECGGVNGHFVNFSDKRGPASRRSSATSHTDST